MEQRFDIKMGCLGAGFFAAGVIVFLLAVTSCSGGRASEAGETWNVVCYSGERVIYRGRFSGEGPPWRLVVWVDEAGNEVAIHNACVFTRGGNSEDHDG